jgi:hypothetical protein
LVTRRAGTPANHPRAIMDSRSSQIVVPINGADIPGTFPDGSTALREGFGRFGVVRFLVRQIADPEPVVYPPTWCGDRMPRPEMPIGDDGPISST